MNIKKLILETVKKTLDSDIKDQLFNYYTTKKELEETNFSFLKIPKRKYGDKVIECLVNIITTTEGISEKSFKMYDEAIERSKNIVLQEDNIQIVYDNFKKNMRPELTAELIYATLK